MSFLTPTSLLLGLLAVPIVLLYMLKLRRREVEVSSTMLWQMLLRDRQANAPWQRLRRNLLLLLQLLILAGLVAALARPAIPVQVVASGPVIVLLDASASMQAADIAPNRFSAATETVGALIDDLNADSTLTLILVGPQPEILASGERDKPALRQALANAHPTQGTVDWQAAFALAAGAAGRGQAETTIVIVSDGGLPAEGLPPLPAKIRYAPIGQSANNLAISAMALRPASRGAELFARVVNYGDSDRTVILSVSIDDTFYTTQRLEIPADESRTVTLENLPDTPSFYEARLENVQIGEPIDDFPLDDVAFAVFHPLTNRNTLLVSGGNLFLEQLLAILPNITPFRVVPDESGELALPNDPFGIYVFDGIIPDKLPPTDLLLINPPANELFDVNGETDQLSNPVVADHPLTQFVAWDNVHVLQAKRVSLPLWADALVDTDSTPLVFAGETEGRRIAVVTFDLHNSDLPLQVAYPILFSNLFRYLAPAQAFDAPDGLAPNEAILIRPGTAVDQVIIASPSGQTYSPALTENGFDFRETGALGLYAVNYISDNAQSADFFAVNLFAPAESDIRPNPDLKIGQTTITQTSEDTLGQRELWPWLAAIAIMIITLEWWVYHRYT
ncbi:MAG: BatA and WFA domain-containing protein [Anaerolineales bacterium]